MVVSSQFADSVKEEKRSAGKHFARTVAPTSQVNTLGLGDFDIDKEESITSS